MAGQQNRRSLLSAVNDKVGTKVPEKVSCLASMTGRNPEVFSYNTSRAQELALWAGHHAPETLDALHDVLFRVVQVALNNTAPNKATFSSDPGAYRVARSNASRSKPPSPGSRSVPNS